METLNSPQDEPPRVYNNTDHPSHPNTEASKSQCLRKPSEKYKQPDMTPASNFKDIALVVASKFAVVTTTHGYHRVYNSGGKYWSYIF